MEHYTIYIYCVMRVSEVAMSVRAATFTCMEHYTHVIILCRHRIHMQHTHGIPA